MSRVLREVIVGSYLHGTATADSDIDLRGIVLPTLREYLSPFPVRSDKTMDARAQDHVFYDLPHFCRLAAKGNPTALEVLWSPLTTQSTPLGDELVAQRCRFLDARAIRASHLGYAQSAWKRFQRDKEEGKAKGKMLAAALRVLIQGRDLLRTGDFSPRVTEERQLITSLKAGWTPEHEAAVEHCLAQLSAQVEEAYRLFGHQFSGVDVTWIELFLVRAFRGGI